MESIFGDDGGAVYKKLRAGGISPWLLVFTGGKGAFTCDDPRCAGQTAPSPARDWDEFVDTFIHPDDRALVRENMAQAVASPDNDFRAQFRLRDLQSASWKWHVAFGSQDPPHKDGRLRLSGGLQTIPEPAGASLQGEKDSFLNNILIESLPGWYMILGIDGRILYKSGLFPTALPPGVEEACLSDWTVAFLENDRAKAAKAIADTANGLTHGFRSPVMHADGQLKYYWFQCRRFQENTDERVLVIVLDVTTETLAELEVQRQRSQLDTVISAANLGTWDWNLITGEVTYNTTWAEIVGYELDEIQGSVSAWENAVLPDDLPKAMAAVEAHVAGETPMYEAEFRMLRKDGSVIWGLDRGRVVERDEEGGVIRLLGVLQDITTEKEATSELISSKNQMEMILREVRFGTWDWNLETEDIHFNDTFFSMLGYEPGELESNFTVWEKLVHPDDFKRVGEALVPLEEGRVQHYECEMRMLHKDGHYVWTYDMGRAVAWDENGKTTRAVGGHVDIDRRIRQEREQKEALTTIALQKKVLEQTVRERTELLRSIRERVNAIAADTGQTAGLTKPNTGLGAGWDEADHDDFSHALEDSSHFADGLGNAFDVITEKMWWYKGVIDSIPFPIYVTDMDDCWTYLNAPALENLGVQNLKDVVGRKSLPWGVEQPDGQDSGPDTKKDTRKDDGPDNGSDNGPDNSQDNGQATAQESAGERDAGGHSRSISRYNPERKRYFQGQASFLRDQTGRRIGHIEAMQDVTKMHEADQRMRIMLDAMPLACNFWNASYECIDCNLAAPVLFGVADKQEYMKRFFDFLPEEQPDGSNSREQARARIQQAFEQGHCSFEWLFRRLDGVFMPAEITLERVVHDGEHIVLGYTRDLTELKEKEAEVDKERRLLTKIMDSSPVCFVILVRGEVRFATPFALKFFGMGVGACAGDLFVDNTAREEFFAEVKRSGAVSWRIVAMRAADGSARDMLANAFRAEYFGEPCVMSWLLDVTEMRETERQLRLARDAAEQSTRAKGEFLANMSHEIRTPMNAILGMTRLVLDTQLSTRQRGYLEKAEKSARALLRILNDILDFSKIEAGKLEMEMADFPLAEIMQAVYDMFKNTAAGKGLEFTLDVETRGPLYLRGDPLRLHQVLINLVGNALKFTSSGGVTVSVTELARTTKDVRLSFSVRDTGIGLTSEQVKGLFSAFSQADTSTTRRYGGTGLGLAISKRLVEMMQGEISCHSEKDKGADFRFTALFPFADAGSEQIYSPGINPPPDHEGPQPGHKAEEAVAHLSGTHILVAEDNDINQIVVREMLEKAGFIVDIAANGQEAIDKALANQYDLIFMDIQMPVMDGLTATAALREYEHLRTIPIIAMTAHAMVGDREKSLAVGMNAHVTKPIDPDEVFAVIARWVGVPRP